MPRWFRWLIFSLLLLGFWALPAPSQDTPHVATGRGGAVASVDRRATEIGIDVLKRGGNAVDAAVATAAALGVTEPFSAGIGGGGFMVIYLKDSDQIITLDGREEAPAAVTPDLFQDPKAAAGTPLPFFPNRISSGLAVGVPGTPLNWSEALSRFGTLSLAEALAPAIQLAEAGFTVDATFASQVAANQERFSAFSSTHALYLPGGAPPVVGSRFRNPDLARTYRQLAAQGVNSFYRGDIGRAIVDAVQRPPTVAEPSFAVLPGAMTTADLNRYEVRVRPAVANTYRHHRIYGMGLPSSGGLTVAETLNILSGLELSQMPRPQALHALIEAERLAFADRNAYLGDPEYVDVPQAGLLSEGYASLRAGQLPDRGATEEFRAAPGNPLPFQNDPSPSRTEAITATQGPRLEGLSTTHLTVADGDGNVVAYTLTIEMTGGSGIVVPGYGFLLNNELTDFDPVVPHPNTPEAGKRPRSSMAPTIAFTPDGSVLAFGSPGGSTIITTVLGIATNVFDFDMDLPAAIAAPRISQRNGGATLVEAGFISLPVAEELRNLGHTLTVTQEIGAATGILVKADGTMMAAAEPVRRGGGVGMTVSQEF